MPQASSNGIEIEYETIGDRSHPPLLLVMGLGGQLTAWPDELCAMLAGRRFLVTRFDNRDCGLSTTFEGKKAPDLAAILGGDRATAPYRIENMAADAAGLIEALGHDSAHVVGVSMGGMIAQSLAIHHPWRVRSLCSIMSTTGGPSVGQPSAAALDVLLRPPATTREGAIAASVAGSRVISSPGFPFDEARVHEMAAAAYDRSYRPQGVARQLAAILASPDRTEGLRALRIPTVVIHGDADPLVAPSGGEATAAAVPDAELVVVPGMGHDLPPAVWETVTDAVVANVARSGGAPPG